MTPLSELLSREDYWIKKVMSVYPFGLNDQITGVGNMTRQNLVDLNFADPFYQYPERRRLRDHGNRNNRNKNVNYNIAEIISNLKSIYNQMGLKKFVDAIKGTTKELLLMILQKVLVNKNKFERRFVDILSVCVGRSRQYTESKSYSNRNKIRVKLNYSSKILDIINISSLISARDVKSKIPEEYCDYDIEIINKYNNPIGSRICNYNKILENLSEDDINDNRLCICERNSTHNKVRELIYSPVGHVVTGNLGIVDKLGNLDQLKRVLQLGYKYRVQSSNVTWGRIKRDLMVTVESLKNKIIDKNNGNVDDLNDWERILKRRVNNRIRAMQNSHTLEQFRYGIDISLLDKQIDIIHKHFVITTVDKASKNFAFSCKKF